MPWTKCSFADVHTTVINSSRNKLERLSPSVLQISDKTRAYPSGAPYVTLQ